MKTFVKTFQVIAYVYLILSICLGFCLLVFSERIGVQLAKSLIISEDYAKADAIILLGGEEGYKRLTKAVQLFNDGYGDIIINSGNGSNEDASRMFANNGILEIEYINESKSTTTFENALFTKDIVVNMGYESIIIVSTPQQSKRARWIFDKVYSDLDVEVYSAVVDNSEFVPEDIKNSKFTKEQFVVQFVKKIYYYKEYWFD